MKRLGYFTVLVILSLASVTFFTTVTAITLASYAKSGKNSSTLVKHLGEDTETVRR